MLSYIYTCIQFIPIFVISAFSGSFKYHNAEKIVEDERKALESRATEDYTLANIRAKGF